MEPNRARPQGKTLKTPSTRTTASESPVFATEGHHPAISVVVLSKDEPELAASLELLRPQCEALNAQCIVVDASEGRLEFIHVAHPWVTWIGFIGPFWRSSTIPHQRNVGCRAATGDIIAFCDSGSEPGANWLASITARLRRGECELVCGPIYPKKEGVFPVCNDVADGVVVPSAPTANLAFFRSVFDQINGFDERLFYGSDVDFTWRCANAGFMCYQVREADMIMDFGSTSLSMRRSWRYGRGWARLYAQHPDRHIWMMRNSPERVIYPLWILLGPLALLARSRRTLRWAPLGWMGILGLLLARNRKAPRPRAVIADHVVGGASVLNETLRRWSGEMAPVIFFPDDEAPYLRSLSEALKTQGTPVDFWRGPTKSATVNIVLGPIWAVFLAWRGVRIIHIHWTYPFSRSSGALGGRLARWWFGLFLKVAHVAGLKIVWTAHNVLPHEAVFDDDVTARALLISHADAIIALSPVGAQEVTELFGVTKIAVISHGPMEIQPSAIGRDAARRALDVNERPCFAFFGNLRQYKGLETLISVAELLGPSISVRIAGRGDATYVEQLTLMTASANAAGADIQLRAQWQSESEVANLLAASDFCVFPFLRTDNSGSVLLALAAGVPVIIPDIPQLRHIENAGVLRYDSTNPAISLRDVMAGASSMSATKVRNLGSAARKWALDFNWSDIAEETAAIYAQTVRGT
jgi:glycosyltransferase involved in cell wall biosynthesis